MLERICAILVALVVSAVILRYENIYAYGEAEAFLSSLDFSACLLLVPSVILLAWRRIPRVRFYFVIALMMFSGFVFISVAFIALFIAIIPFESLWTRLMDYHKNNRGRIWRQVETWALVILASAAAGAFGIFFMTAVDLDVRHNKSRKGCHIMSTLNEKNCETWEQRTLHYLNFEKKNENQSGFSLSNKTSREPVISDELRKMGIIEIYIQKNQVEYVWNSGMRYTAMTVRRLDDGSFEFFGAQHGEHINEIWPKGKTEAK